MTATSIADITAALRAADIDYRLQHAGTDFATVIITRADGDEIALGPSVSYDGGDDDGVNVGYYNGTVADGEFGTQDWHPTATAAVASIDPARIAR